MASSTCGNPHHLLGGFMLREKFGIAQHGRTTTSLKVDEGWETLFSRLPELEALRIHPRNGKQRQLNSFHLLVKATTRPQNVDLPPVLPRKKKKPSIRANQPQTKRPYLTPEEASLRSPANGLLVTSLIPVAHDVMAAKAVLIKGIALLMKEIPVKACRFCPETHVGIDGHDLRTCKGPKSAARNSLHCWVKGTIDDVFVPVEAYHLADRLAVPVAHDRRFDVDRILAIDELCIQAGVDVPEYPTKRYTQPIHPGTRKRREDASWSGGERFQLIEADRGNQPIESFQKTPLEDISFRGVEDVLHYQDDNPTEYQKPGGVEPLLEPKNPHFGKEDLIPLVDVSNEDDLQTVGQKTLRAWDRMRRGAKKLMSKYRVVACGYCPEVHVGPRGHRARVCGAFKHQWRDGKHGWQDASLDELVPPKYVWHLRDRHGPPLENKLRKFYGQAPALVELCAQGGAPVPEFYKALMRLDVAIPTLEEVEIAV